MSALPVEGLLYSRLFWKIQTTAKGLRHHFCLLSSSRSCLWCFLCQPAVLKALILCGLGDRNLGFFKRTFHMDRLQCDKCLATCLHARVPVGMLQASARELALLPVETLSAAVDVFATDYLEEKKGSCRFLVNWVRAR